MKKKLLTILMVVAIVGVLGFAFTGCKKEVYSNYQAINLDMGTTHYVGTQTYSGSSLVATVDLGTYFTGSTITSSDPKLTISGTTATVSGEGDATMSVDATTYTVKIVDAVNITSYEDLVKAMADDKAVVIQSKTMELPASDTVHVTNDIYGNGCKINANKLVSQEYKHFLNIEAGTTDLVIQDLHISGRDMAEGDSLTVLEKYGTLINWDGKANERISGTLKHCILENGHKVVHFSASDVTIDGCIIRCASDSTVSVRTADNVSSSLTFHNNIIGDSVTAGITIYGYEDIDANNGTEYDYNKINITGYMDVYGWKNANDICIMPGTEALASTVNPLVSQTIKGKKYRSFLYEYKGESYVHFAIIFLSTNKSNLNQSTMTGNETLSLNQRDFPLPGIAYNFMTGCILFGYEESNDIVTPTSTLAANPRLAENGFTVVK